MFYPQNIEDKLEFDKIRDLLKKYCISALGRKEVETMSYMQDFDSVSLEMGRAKEFKNLLEAGIAFPYENYYDCREYLARLSTNESYLTENELFELKLSLETIGRVLAFFASKEAETCPLLRELAGGTDACKPIVRQIDNILDKYGHVKDNASKELFEIRNKKASESAYISKTMRVILARARSEGYVEDDAQPVMRGDRLVLPVTAAGKRKIPGIVHDESATGKTLFIEPAELVEASNRIRSLEAAERREILKILRECSNFIRPMTEGAMLSYDFLAKMDFIRAKAKFAAATNGDLPQLQNKAVMQWSSARHPLLQAALEKQGKELVPLDINLNGKDRILLISGPNAGGKSVCLKTAGVVQYMGQCGMLPTVSADSVFGMFKDIFIDIGDEQSIENNLSTYSSHLGAMKFFLRSGSGKTLLLIDEFGSGTEPVIGGAIAEAELEVFAQNGCYGIITTHYSNLKHLAASTDGIKNAAMLYDRHRMEPLFKLETGTPGSSFAIEIARKIGLGEDIIAAAIRKAGEENINYDKNLQDIARDKRYWENKRQQVRVQAKKMEERNAELEKRMAGIKEREREIIAKARQQAEEILKQANTTVENTVRQIKESSAEKEATKQAKQKLQAFSQSISHLGRAKEERKKQTATNYKEGDYVKYADNVGTVISVNGNKLIVAFGNIQASMDKSQLQPAKQSDYEKTRSKSYNFVSSATNEQVRSKNLNFKNEIDVRGMRVDEALQAVIYFIDDATVVGATRLRILHGTGTGALRQEIRKYLSTLPHIASYHDEHVQLGGAGITVVEFE